MSGRVVNTRILSGRIRDFKIHFRAFATADPIPLHFLERMTPVNAFEIASNRSAYFVIAASIGASACEDRKAADFAFAVNDFLVRQHGAEFRAPVHRRFGDIGKAAVFD